MKKMYINPPFIIGLSLKILLITTLTPLAVEQWYAPFLAASVNQLTIDPWRAWIEAGGDKIAFPYGYAMWFVFLPLTIIFKIFSANITIAYKITLLIFDLFLFVLLTKIIPSRERLVLCAYWLSPIVIIGTYVLGFNDLVPIYFLTLSLYFIYRLRLFWAGVCYVIAVSAKLSMLLALPFYIIFLLHSKRLHRASRNFILGFVIATTIFILPFVLSPFANTMLLSNPEIGKVFQLSLPIGNNVTIYFVPLAYLIMLYGAWRIKRLNFNLFQSILTIAFLLVVLLTPATLGWFIWVVPSIVIYLASSDIIAMFLVAVFSGLYVISGLSLADYQLHNQQVSIFNFQLPLQSSLIFVASLLQTIFVAVGILLALKMWRESIVRNDYFRLSRSAFVLGIAGDSGSGKDCLADALEGLFGQHSVTKLSGDDYHLWDRRKPIWQVMTHLNPLANDLESFSSDLFQLIDGKPIVLRNYDHKTGIRGDCVEVKSNDIIIASGLHTLYTPLLRSCLNLSVYLDMDEGLRRYLKIRRDVQNRGHDLKSVIDSFSRREPDSVKFIRPQEAYADLILSLQPLFELDVNDIESVNALRLKLVVKSRNGLNELALVRTLVGVCGLHVDMNRINTDSEAEFTIEGESTADDVALAAKLLCSRALEFLDIEPKWEDGVLGLMQLVTLSHVDQALTKRML